MNATKSDPGVAKRKPGTGTTSAPERNRAANKFRRETVPVTNRKRRGTRFLFDRTIDRCGVVREAQSLRTATRGLSGCDADRAIVHDHAATPTSPPCPFTRFIPRSAPLGSASSIRHPTPRERERCRAGRTQPPVTNGGRWTGWRNASGRRPPQPRRRGGETASHTCERCAHRAARRDGRGSVFPTDGGTTGE